MAFRTPIESDLERIRTLFLQMCVRSESMVQLAVRSVLERDPHLGRSVVAADRELDQLEVEIDRRCMQCLAVRQPVGQDLRLVTMAMKMVTDLERIGDLAVNIAERGLELSASSGLEPGDELPRMGALASEMLRMAADGFVSGDTEVRDTLRARDKEMDQLNRASFERLIQVMSAHPDQADRALSYTSISKHLERVADHAVNLGEMVVFLVAGEDVRHAP